MNPDTARKLKILPLANVSEHDKTRSAYINMAKRAKYRPKYSGDRFGRSKWIAIRREASACADELTPQEGSRRVEFRLSRHAEIPGSVYAIEAARLLCAGDPENTEQALTLLHMAIESVPRPKQRD
jgi:hypothetical protein